MNQITTVGVDLAKDVIAVCGADRSGKRAADLGHRETLSAFGVPKGRAAQEWVSGSNRGRNACRCTAKTR